MACNSVCSITKLHSSSFTLCPFSFSPHQWKWHSVEMCPHSSASLCFLRYNLLTLPLVGASELRSIQSATVWSLA